MSKLVDDNQEIEKEIREAVMNAISDVSDYTKEKNDFVMPKHTGLLETLKNVGFSTLQNIFDASLNNQASFYCIYMKLFESTLFIRAIRVLGITLVQPPQIMSIFLCVRHDELCKNDLFLSLADVRPERKRSENVGHND